MTDIFILTLPFLEVMLTLPLLCHVLKAVVSAAGEGTTVLLEFVIRRCIMLMNIISSALWDQLGVTFMCLLTDFNIFTFSSLACRSTLHLSFAYAHYFFIIFLRLNPFFSTFIYISLTKPLGITFVCGISSARPMPHVLSLYFCTPLPCTLSLCTAFPITGTRAVFLYTTTLH